MRPLTRELAASALGLLTIMPAAPLRGQDRFSADPASAYQVPSNLYLLRGETSAFGSSYVADSSKGTPDYRYEGAVAGAVVFGAGALFLSGWCEDAGCPNRATFTLGGIVIGGLFGLLIGGMMTK